MTINPPLHSWDLSPDEAVRIQRDLCERLMLSWDEKPVTTIGGVDVSVKTEAARAAIVVICSPYLVPLEAVIANAPLVFPYIPGLLAFRGAFRPGCLGNPSEQT